jgi:hypothetical protein
MAPAVPVGQPSGSLKPLPPAPDFAPDRQPPRLDKPVRALGLAPPQNPLPGAPGGPPAMKPPIGAVKPLHGVPERQPQGAPKPLAAPSEPLVTKLPAVAPLKPAPQELRPAPPAERLAPPVRQPDIGAPRFAPERQQREAPERQPREAPGGRPEPGKRPVCGEPHLPPCPK